MAEGDRARFVKLTKNNGNSIVSKTNRFVDHMHSEHEVKHEPEVVLAVSVN